MINVGIICEYNPFHNGHLYHINKIKEMFKEVNIILVMSGNFTQRGDLSIIDKWDKTKIALECGVDLVIELPFIYATQSADIFAYGAINILEKMNVDYIVFGSELNDIDTLNKLADIQINNKNYEDRVKKYMNEGLNYPTALSKSLKDYSNISINNPNDILGLCYIKQLKLNGSNIKAISIKRTNDYNSTELNNYISSASSIRKAIINGIDVKDYVPDITNQFLKQKLFFLSDYFPYLKYKILTDINNLTIYQSVDEDLANRIKKYIYESSNLDEFIDKLKTKRYTYNRIKRMCLHILVGLKKEDINDISIKYIRVLGFNNKGKKYLKDIKKTIDVPIITNYKNSKSMLNLEFKVNSILSVPLDKDEQNNLIKRELTHKPIIK